jgi:LPXTG-motif cell wall-anchored protein
MWLVVGLLFVACGAALAASYYVLGMPILMAHTVPPRPANAAEVLTNVFTLAGGGGLFAVMGAVILLRRRRD